MLRGIFLFRVSLPFFFPPSLPPFLCVCVYMNQIYGLMSNWRSQWENTDKEQEAMSLKEGKGWGTSEGFEGEKGKGNDVVVL